MKNSKRRDCLKMNWLKIILLVLLFLHSGKLLSEEKNLSTEWEKWQNQTLKLMEVLTEYGWKARSCVQSCTEKHRPQWENFQKSCKQNSNKFPLDIFSSRHPEEFKEKVRNGILNIMETCSYKDPAIRDLRNCILDCNMD